jgi:hypothetical protein
MTAYDHEVLFELRDEPELLAIADALADVLQAPTTRSRARWATVAAAATAVAALAAVLLLSGGKVHHGLVDNALAALGDGPVVHAVTREQTPYYGELVNVQTGEAVHPEVVTDTETWFDQAEGLRKTIYRRNGELVDEILETPSGSRSTYGTVWTCASIKRHPVEATKAGVSCRFDGKNGTKPQDVPEDAPIEPRLAGFLQGYRQALESGGARKAGETTVDGRRLEWLEFDVPDSLPSGAQLAPGQTQEVAVDSQTFEPVLLRDVVDGKPGPISKFVKLELVGRDQADFSEPAPASRDGSPEGWQQRPGRLEITAAEASEALGTRALWAGPKVGGLELGAIIRTEVALSYPKSVDGPRNATAIAFIYGEVEHGRPSQTSLVITESTVPVPGLVSAPPTPPLRTPGDELWTAQPDWMLFDISSGFLRRGPLYVSIRAPFPHTATSPGPDALVLATARALAPLPAP